MGVSIDLQQRGKWVDITPGWRSQMASWLSAIGGDREIIVFTERDIPALRYHRRHQCKADAPPPFDQCKEWTQCFDRIIRQIKSHGTAAVRMQW